MSTIDIDIAILTRLLGQDIIDVKPEPIVAGGGHSRIFSCRTATDDLILRICQGKQGYYTHYFPNRVNWDEWMDQRWAITVARAAGIPAPEILFSDRDRRWVVMKRLPGKQIEDYEKWNRCPYDEEHFGLLLHKLHSITPAGWGPINDTGDALFRTWNEFLLETAISAINTCCERKALSSAICRRIEKCLLPALNDIHLDKPSLLHMESLGFANILYDPDMRTITGLLDYEDCLSGDPLFEMAWMRYYFEHDGVNQRYFDFTRFGIGYGHVDWKDDRLILYRAFAYIDKLRWITVQSERACKYAAELESIAGKM